MKITLIGGAGYIGSRLTLALERRGHECLVIDPRILSSMTSGNPQMDVRNIEPRPADVTIWLASIHDVPDEDRDHWGSIAAELMIHQPERWAKAAKEAGGRFIYLSSTRAGTHRNRLYGWCKARFENVRPYETTVVRPGTVWGALSATLPNRTHTVINNMLINPAWEPEARDEPFFTCHYKLLERVICDLVKEPGHCWNGLVVPVTDTVLPITGAKLAGGWRPKGFSYEKVPYEVLERQEEHPMALYEKYYFPEGPCAST